MEQQAVQLATFGAGCFWCVEAVFEQLDGVTDVVSGYMGGAGEHPSYEAVCTGVTGHAEVVQISFDPAVISYPTLLDWLFRSHDPTTLNRQGADSGTQYRSVIFYHDDQQRGEGLAKIAELGEAAVFAGSIVTEVTPAGVFYPAEGCHQDYYRLNKHAPYCRAVIGPKLARLGLAGDGGGAVGQG